MMIGLAESLVASRGFDPVHFLEQLRANYEPARGYGKGMKLIFRAMDQGTPLEELGSAAWASGSRGNGAAVRVAPLACHLRKDLQTLGSEASRSAAVTHAHPEARSGAMAVAVGVGLLLGSTTAQFDGPAFLERLATAAETSSTEMAAALRSARGPRTEGALPPGPLAIESVPAALRAFLEQPGDFEGAVATALRIGGDTDSIGAMSGALAGALCGARAIPAPWLASLEEGLRGRRHVERLAEQLAVIPG